MPSISRRSFNLGALSLGAALVIAPAARAGDGFPLTVKHAFGETTFQSAPKRIVTIGWMTQDAVVALGIAPLAVPEQAWGGDENKLLPWLTAALKDKGMALPERINFDQDIPYEQVLALQPDAILAFYSGLTQEQYDHLSAIAPVAAYPDQPWANNWHDVTLATGQVLGQATEAQAIIDGINAQIDAAAAAHPQFKGKTFTFGSLWVGDNGMNVYSTTDPRVQLMTQLGFVASPGVVELSKAGGYFFTVSFENLSTIDADIVILLDEGGPDSDALYEIDMVKRFKPVAEGRMLRLKDKAFIMATSAPSVLGLPWALEQLVPQLATIVKA